MSTQNNGNNGHKLTVLIAQVVRTFTDDRRMIPLPILGHIRRFVTDKPQLYTDRRSAIELAQKILDTKHNFMQVHPLPWETTGFSSKKTRGSWTIYAMMTLRTGFATVIASGELITSYNFYGPQAKAERVEVIKIPREAELSHETALKLIEGIADYQKRFRCDNRIAIPEWLYTRAHMVHFHRVVFESRYVAEHDILAADAPEITINNVQRVTSYRCMRTVSVEGGICCECGMTRSMEKSLDFRFLF